MKLVSTKVVTDDMINIFSDIKKVLNILTATQITVLLIELRDSCIEALEKRPSVFNNITGNDNITSYGVHLIPVINKMREAMENKDEIS